MLAVQIVALDGPQHTLPVQVLRDRRARQVEQRGHHVAQLNERIVHAAARADETLRAADEHGDMGAAVVGQRLRHQRDRRASRRDRR